MEQPVTPEELSSEHGEFLVRLARRAVEEYLRHGRRIEAPPETPAILRRKGAAFVTIESITPTGGYELRGCIGLIYPVKPLADTVIEAAIEAATEDPRFPPMRPEELERVVFEVSVLGPFEKLPRDPAERVKAVKVGVHGLLVKRGFFQGLLLPQVPVEYLWDEETFLSETCVKAGMPPSCWLDEDTEIYRFTARIWKELEPGGRIVERKLLEELSRRLKGMLG